MDKVESLTVEELKTKTKCHGFRCWCRSCTLLRYLTGEIGVEKEESKC